MMNAFARMRLYFSMDLYAFHAIILVIMISMKTNANNVERIRFIVLLVKFVNPVLKLILISMVLNALPALIKQSGMQQREIVKLAKEERFIQPVIVNAHKISNFGIKLPVLNVMFLNSLITLFLNVFSALINKFTTLRLLNVLIVQSKILILMVINALLALQLLSTILLQKNVNNVH